MNKHEKDSLLDEKMRNDLSQFLTLRQTQERNDFDYPRLKNLIALAYIDLLESIAAGDKEQIRKISEGDLYRAFSEGLDELNFETKEIKVLNIDEELGPTDDDKIDKLFDIEVLGADQVFGVSIDRETNRRITYNKVKTSQLRAYVPSELDYGQKLSMIM